MSGVGDINLAAIVRRDPSAVEVIDSSTHVALYNFDPETSSWDKGEVEGSLFVYRRKRAPLTGLVVLNKLSMDDYLQMLVPEFQVEDQPPYILCKKRDGNIEGIWFFDDNDCRRIAQLLKRFTADGEMGNGRNSVTRIFRRTQSECQTTGHQANDSVLSLLASAKRQPLISPLSPAGPSSILRPRPLKGLERSGGQRRSVAVDELFLRCDTSRRAAAAPPPSSAFVSLVTTPRLKRNGGVVDGSAQSEASPATGMMTEHEPLGGVSAEMAVILKKLSVTTPSQPSVSSAGFGGEILSPLLLPSTTTGGNQFRQPETEAETPGTITGTNAKGGSHQPRLCNRNRGVVKQKLDARNDDSTTTPRQGGGMAHPASRNSDDVPPGLQISCDTLELSQVSAFSPGGTTTGNSTNIERVFSTTGADNDGRSRNEGTGNHHQDHQLLTPVSDQSEAAVLSPGGIVEPQEAHPLFYKLAASIAGSVAPPATSSLGLGLGPLSVMDHGPLGGVDPPPGGGGARILAFDGSTSGGEPVVRLLRPQDLLVSGPALGQEDTTARIGDTPIDTLPGGPGLPLPILMPGPVVGMEQPISPFSGSCNGLPDDKVLTRQQFQIAFEHMLQTDTNFVDALYQSYLHAAVTEVPVTTHP